MRRCTYSTPIGYLDRGSNNKPLDPERAPIVKRIFELYATGEWSLAQLGKWVREQGLTKKPTRRKRTQDELLGNLHPATIPRVARPADHKTVEYILKNPFYIGKIKTRDGYLDGVHEPLIDPRVFARVQQTLKARNRTIHYVDKPFFTYRGLLRCTCGRLYSPYEQKGIVYYRSRCKPGCDNPDPNLEEKGDINAAVAAILGQIAFTDEELAEIEAGAKEGLARVSAQRDRELADLHAKQRRIAADLSYLAENRVTILRTGVMTAEAVRSDEERLEAELERVNAEIAARGASAQEMLDFTIAFSELVKNASSYFEHALESEKRELTTEVFSELVFKDRRLAKYEAKEGFVALLKRKRQTGSCSGQQF
jgi:site-specific DNA recombinase